MTVAVLPTAGGQDVPAYRFQVRLELLTHVFRPSLSVRPFRAHHAPKRACPGLRASDRRGTARDEPRHRPGRHVKEAES
ncbi:hypothetical protein ACFWIJ_31380 [Streptomyces sp. NPDC127079]|uniref:hypothetical protein n=1 Tax=Streptomyces sp. NPDC127079 TaxID=3347132 RepID=UPI0036686FC7